MLFRSQISVNQQNASSAPCQHDGEVRGSGRLALPWDGARDQDLLDRLLPLLHPDSVCQETVLLPSDPMILSPDESRVGRKVTEDVLNRLEVKLSAFSHRAYEPSPVKKCVSAGSEGDQRHQC